MTSSHFYTHKLTSTKWKSTCRDLKLDTEKSTGTALENTFLFIIHVQCMVNFTFTFFFSTPDLLTGSVITGADVCTLWPTLGVSPGTSFLIPSRKTQYTNFVIRQDHQARGDSSHDSQCAAFIKEKDLSKINIYDSCINKTGPVCTSVGIRSGGIGADRRYFLSFNVQRDGDQPVFTYFMTTPIQMI